MIFELSDLSHSLELMRKMVFHQPNPTAAAITASTTSFVDFLLRSHVPASLLFSSDEKVPTTKITKKFISSSNPYHRPPEPPPPHRFNRPKLPIPPKMSAREKGMNFFSHLNGNTESSGSAAATTPESSTASTVVTSPLLNISGVLTKPHDRNTVMLLRPDLDLKSPDLDYISFDLALVCWNCPCFFSSLLLLLGNLDAKSGQMEPVVVNVKVLFAAMVKDASDGLGSAIIGLDCCIDGLNHVVDGLDHVVEGLDFVPAGLDDMAVYGLVKYYVGQLDCLLNVPRRPPDPLHIILFICIYYYISGSRPQTITRNLSRFPKILLSHKTQLQALGDLFFCPPTVGLYVDRSTVALYAWGYLSFNGSGKVSMVGRVWFPLT